MLILYILKGGERKVKLIGYCRVSTDHQGATGTITLQQRSLMEYAKKEKHNLVKVFSHNGFSGGLENRPELANLFEYIKNNKDIEGILIFKFDRLAREMRIQENLLYDFKKRGLKLISVREPDLNEDNPERVIMRQMFGMISQYEKEMITMRLTAGRLKKAKKGSYAGGMPPFGYNSRNKTLIPDVEKVETIKTIFNLKRYKRKSLREIATHLNDRGIKPTRGERWHPSSIAYILSNGLYMGRVEYKGIKAVNDKLAIV